MDPFVEELTWRGLVQQVSDPQLASLMRDERFTLYCGFDPTADSLHVGSLVPILTLVRAQRAGHRPVALVGGATGLIGDPSGKSEERKLLDPQVLAKNLAGIRAQLERFLDFGDQQALMANNADWFEGYGYLAFLRDVGKHFTVNAMLGKESVRARLEDREHGISYTEFSYMLIQAYDFLCLHDRQGCRLQVGGSDQWGNITAGIELIRRVRQKPAYALTTPLVTTASGQKFGKTEQGTVWLDASRTPPYDFHQFFLRTDDRDVGRFLRYYTFLSPEEVAALEALGQSAPEKREAQHVLAREVTTLVHGAAAAKEAEQTAQALFSSRTAGTGVAIPVGAPSSEERLATLEGTPLVDILVRAKLSGSKGAARRDIAGGGIYLNDQRVDDAGRILHTSDVTDGNVLLLRKGKKSYHVIRLV